MKRILFFISIFLFIFISYFAFSTNASDPYARRINPMTSHSGSCSENQIGYDMTVHILYICTNGGWSNLTSGTITSVNGVAFPTTAATFDSIPILTASNTIGYYRINSGSSCGDSSHALSYNQTTHLFGCQAISGGGGGITNSAGAGVFPLSDGTNLITSDIAEDAGDITIGSASHVVTLGDIGGNGNNTKITVDDLYENIILANDNGNVVLSSGGVLSVNGAEVLNENSIISATNGGTAINTSSSSGTPIISGGVWSVTPGLAVPISAIKPSNQLSSSTTFANISALSIPLQANTTYEFTIILFVSDSVAADGAKIDFNGGSTDVSNFRAHITSFDSTLNLSTQVTSISTSSAMATLTGASMIEIHGSISTAGSGGTFIPRFAQNAHTTGSLTCATGSSMIFHK